MDEANLVQTKEMQARVAAEDARELFVVGGLAQLVDQGRGGDVAAPPAGFGGGGAESYKDVGLAGAGVAEQYHGLARGDPGPAAEAGQGRRRQARLGG